MKPRNSTDEPPRFSGQIRHYHRGGARPQKTWDEWVDGKSAKSGASKNWMKIAGVLAGVLALAGIITGLIIELS
ncbi:MAG: hypothetical protein ABIT37_17740 [Luteolibacter sp.]